MTCARRTTDTSVLASSVRVDSLQQAGIPNKRSHFHAPADFGVFGETPNSEDAVRTQAVEIWPRMEGVTPLVASPPSFAEARAFNEQKNNVH